MEKHGVAAVNEIVPGCARVLTVAGLEIGLFAVAGGYRAYRNFCPHAGAPICRGEITRLRVEASSEPGAAAQPGREILRCPWHAWEFDLASGENLAAPSCRLESFPVEVINGQLVVSI
jgi:nitrite reductase (NADH) small subunit